MSESFFIPVIYKGEEKNFNAELKVFGYTARFEVDVNGTIVYFEKDEEGSYRAVMPFDSENSGAPVPDVNLLKIIQEKIEELLK
jgi:hypothetical protein